MCAKTFLVWKLWGWEKLLQKAVSLRFPISRVKEKWFSKHRHLYICWGSSFSFNFFAFWTFLYFHPENKHFFPARHKNFSRAVKINTIFGFSYLHSFGTEKVNWIWLLFHSKPIASRAGVWTGKFYCLAVCIFIKVKEISMRLSFYCEDKKQ